MPSSTGFREERAELDAVFASGIFQRAPNLAQLLEYVCTKYFAGEDGQVKEYTIAVEALGRPRDFDQKRDSIVRVEAHHLRKRLLEYYEREGLSHELKIVMPAGQYVPQFVRSLPKESGETGIAAIASAKGIVESVASEAADSGMPSDPPPRQGLPWLGVAGLVVLGAGGILALSMVWLRPLVPDRSTARAAAGLRGDEIRILAGWTEGPYTDPFGHVWQADRHATGGYLTNYAGHMIDARDTRLYQSAREGDFRYDIPLAPGVYELRLYFAEMLFGERNVGGGGEGTRIFSVDANGKRLLDGFDVIADAAGANVADERVFKDVSPDTDGVLHLRFTHMVRDPLLNAIEIRPGIPGRQRPIRLLMSEHGYVDHAGNSWDADRYYRGGQLVARAHGVLGASEPDLYHSARCGNITYTIPVAPGTYSMTLRFAEGWVGTGHPVGGGVGSREFNIFCNSQPLARNFDIYKEAGGPERAIERTFRGLRPSPQGKLVLYLQPVKSYACVNAIEVFDEGK